VLEHTAAVALLADGDGCAGAWLLGHDELRPVHAAATVLATGGAGALYARTTNPPGATGDGIALALLAGAAVADMEFVQFHPTALAGGDGDRALLISEALRGEGARLVDAAGRRFMAAVHPDAELAPRDVVAAAIERRAARGERSYLDVRHLPREAVSRRFANVVEGCRAAGHDLLAGPVPVAPAAHYLMGGVETDVHGATTLPGLYAAGECACTGVHGANRLASNSLLECVVFAERAVAHGLTAGAVRIATPPPPERPLQRAPLPELRRRMWRHAGLVRDADGLARLVGWLDVLPETNPVLGARLIAAAALRRTESRGAHRRRDFPHEDPAQARRLRCPSTISTR
jgi:L-aspartate oxidase